MNGSSLKCHFLALVAGLAIVSASSSEAVRINVTSTVLIPAAVFPVDVSVTARDRYGTKPEFGSSIALLDGVLAVGAPHALSEDNKDKVSGRRCC